MNLVPNQNRLKTRSEDNKCASEGVFVSFCFSNGALQLSSAGTVSLSPFQTKTNTILDEIRVSLKHSFVFMTTMRMTHILITLIKIKAISSLSWFNM